MRGSDELIAYADGATGHRNKHTGVGAVLLNDEGQIVAWANRQLEEMTNNEAEYAGLVLALELAVDYRPGRLHVYLDSAVVVRQMNGRYGVRSPALKGWHRRACQLARHLRQVTYKHIPRERNRLADAMAYEALTGRILRG